jgi:hypothetical protein
MTSALEGVGWSATRPGYFTPGKDSVSIVQEAGWAPGPVWTCVKNLAPHRDRSQTVQPVAILTELSWPITGDLGHKFRKLSEK